MLSAFIFSRLHHWICSPLQVSKFSGYYIAMSITCKSTGANTSLTVKTFCSFTYFPPYRNVDFVINSLYWDSTLRDVFSKWTLKTLSWSHDAVLLSLCLILKQATKLISWKQFESTKPLLLWDNAENIHGNCP